MRILLSIAISTWLLYTTGAYQLIVEVPHVWARTAEVLKDASK